VPSDPETMNLALFLYRMRIQSQWDGTISVEWMREWSLTLNLPTTTIVAQPFNVIKWQLKFNPVT